MDAPIVKDFVSKFNFAKFSGGFDADFGFEDPLKFLGKVGEFVEFLIPVPLCRKPIGPCADCEGTGKDEDSWEEKCLHCDGEGVSMRYDYTEAYAVSASLTVLFRQLAFPEFETGCSLSQLMTVTTVTAREPHGGSMGGQYSGRATAWMVKRGPGEIPEMAAAMRSAWEKMEGVVKSYYQHSFRAWLGDGAGWLCVGCPGDACGLHPEHTVSYDVARGCGYEFSCHNTDNPQQQLTLLASLAALHDLVRREAKN
jgi:hypothetical protein